ncbi:hypothetical protein CHARACLAT_010990 [Characodon lateralis]|uniref:Uncharacterized protein n=1 Tax=Characodon lateralis TaxID=208331 RepID=A0ABU7ELR5_9TELE|nr:hypothetical protein [Characodon lateralis]
MRDTCLHPVPSVPLVCYTTTPCVFPTQKNPDRMLMEQRSHNYNYSSSNNNNNNNKTRTKDLKEDALSIFSAVFYLSLRERMHLIREKKDSVYGTAVSYRVKQEETECSSQG